MTRIAEVVGMLGTSGFLGMVLGTWLGDVMLGGGSATRLQLQLMFVVAAALGVVNVILCAVATRNDNFQPRSRHVSPFALLRRYHPGAVLLVGAASGFGLALPGTFLRPYAESVGIPGIALFFAVYSPTAFVARFSSRGLPARLGNRMVMHLGLASMVVGMLLFTVAVNAWLLALPAVFLGIAHALIFPSTVAVGSEAFPARHRGLATTLILSTLDVGTLIGSPIAGAILSYAYVLSLPAFPTMFVAVAAMIGVSAVVYAMSGRRAERSATSQAGESMTPRLLPASAGTIRRP